MKNIICLLIIAAVFYGNPGITQESVIGAPCEGCDWAFVDMPEEIPSYTRIASDVEEGEPLSIEGTVYSPAGKPAPGIIVYAYHTNSKGIYPGAKVLHGRLRGWAMTDRHGRYRFDTIRPGPYPRRNTPQHIHMHIIEPGKGTYYIDNITFTDDPLLTPKNENQIMESRGGSGETTPRRDKNGTWHVRRDIILGLNVPGY